MGMKIKAILLFVLCYTAYLFGNAEPIDIQSSLKSTGNMVTLQKSNIVIKKESLNIVINGIMANVEVNYTYFNKGGDDKVYLAFPVDFVIGMFDDRKDPTYQDLAMYKIKVNEKKQDYDYIIERNYCEGSDPEQPDLSVFSTTICEEKNIRRWYVTEILFKKNEETRVSINYIVHASGQPQIYSGSPIPKMDNRRVFYDFSPAQYFGMGKADDMEITVDTSELESVRGKIVKIDPEILKEKEKGVFRYSGKDFDFKNNPHLSIEYDVKDLEMFNYFKDHRERLFRFGASSVSDKKYDVKNLFDGKSETAWCFKGEKDQWVEFELLPPVYLNYISIINGYAKDKQVYEENGKVTEFEITSDCEINTCKECYNYQANNKPEIIEWSDSFKKNPFPANKVIWADQIIEEKRSCKVRLKVKKTVKGKKSEDSCISELFLM